MCAMHIENKKKDAQNKCHLVFVVGNSRSGTTIMARLLGRSESIHSFSELHFFEEMWNPATDVVSLDRKSSEELLAKLINTEREDYIGQKHPDKYLQEAREILEGINEDDFNSPKLFREFLLYESVRHGKTIACEQTPRNIFYAKDILDYYPDAKIINMVRDPRAVLLSQKNRWKIRSLGSSNFPIKEVIRSWTNYHPIITSMLWNSSINTGKTSSYNPRLKTIRYEDFVSEPESTVREICNFLGVSYHDDLLKIPQEEGGISSFQRRDKPQGVGINTAAVTRWQSGGLSKAEILICQKITRKNMFANSYEQLPISIIKSFPQLLFLLLTLPIKLTIAVILNYGRHQNFVSTIKRRLGKAEPNL